MTNGAPSKTNTRSRLRIALALIAVLVLALVVPPLIGVSRYKGKIAGLMEESLGRPVRLSSVEVRLLPWPGFVLHDLTVAEDPAYGAEPVLYASKVTASLHLLALWRGRLEIDKISVDDATLNVVRTAPGQWNLDPIFRIAAAQTGATSKAVPMGLVPRAARRLPSLVATNSRIDFKNGAEKLPFSLLNADLSVWQSSPGEWRIRLRGQPARTDVDLHQEETGVVRMEASVHTAASLQQMPLRLDLNWRKAQLGELARLVTGSDPGWRGDLTGDLHLEGTADAARVALRLRAAEVHRAEFAPAAPLDFDANCGFDYRYNRRSIENLACTSPLGNGQLRLTGEKPGLDAPAQFTVELNRIPVAAGLDLLRTLRSSIDPGLEAAGSVSGKIAYAASEAAIPPPVAGVRLRRGRPASVHPSSPFSGSLTVDNFAVNGGGLSQPVQAAKIVLAPSTDPKLSTDALTGAVNIPAGGQTPLAVTLRFALAGYAVGVRGQASLARARELAHAAGIPQTQALAGLAGEPLTVDLVAAGPWMPPEENFFAVASGAKTEDSASQSPASLGDALPAADTLTGTVLLRNANWRSDFLAMPVQIEEASLHFDGLCLRWDPVLFAYGPVKGSAALNLPLNCPAQAPAPQPCLTQFQLQFGQLDAALLQSALLGAPQKTTLLSGLLDRLHPSSSPSWPALEGTVKADALLLGPVTLRDLSTDLRVQPAGAQIDSLVASLLGGSLHVSGAIVKPANDRDKPDYVLNGSFQRLNAASLGTLLGLRWAGAPLNGSGTIELAGYTAADLAASAKGALHFACGRGAMGAPASAKSGQIPDPLARFQAWTGDAAIANGKLTLDRSAVSSVVSTGSRTQSVSATVVFAHPPVVRFAPGEPSVPKPSPSRPPR